MYFRFESQGRHNGQPTQPPNEVSSHVPSCRSISLARRPAFIDNRNNYGEVCARWAFRREGMDAVTTRGRSLRRAWYTVAWPQGRAASEHSHRSATPSPIDPHTGAVLAYVLRRCQYEVLLQLKALLEPFGLTRFYTDHWGT
jgi:hypothetical protein